MAVTIEQFPSRIVLELTPLCNLSCYMCPRHYVKDTDGFMDNALFIKAIDEIMSVKPDAIVIPFWRGESCLHPSFVELIDYALSKKTRVHLSTNGHFMDKKFMDIFYRCEFITFSIHTDLGYNNALKLIQNKPKWSDTTIQISFVDSEKTVQTYLNQCVADKNLNGFNSIRVYKEHTLDGDFGKSDDADKEQNRAFCPKLTHTLVIAADGSYSRCNHIWESEKNIYFNDATTIKDIWNNDILNKIRDAYPDKKCSPCDQWSGNTNGESWRMQNNKIIHTRY
ncbi:MAG: radical SAM protein [Campylobacterales bacterium]|nr:radical SAM protein [Campylobacterales bacterium]